MTRTTSTGTRAPGPGPGQLRRFLPSVLVNAVAPLVVYSVLRSPVHNDVLALAIAVGVPVLFTAATFAVRRRLDPIGVVSITGFVIALAVVLLTGGNELVLKLHEAVLTGPAGLACLISVAVGRPLYGEIWKLAARRNPQLLAGTHRGQRGVSVVMTTLIGAMLFLHALLLLVLALTMSTTDYLAFARPIGWVVIAIFVAVLLWYRNRLRLREPGGRTGTTAGRR